MRKLDGCTALVTGGGRGLGVAIAHTMAEEGCRLVLAGRNAEALGKVRREMETRFGAPVETIVLDLADAASVTAAVAHLSNGPALDILVNNGAMWLEAADEDYATEDVLAVINSALSGTFLLTQGLLPMLCRSLRPDIVTIGSISGLPNAALQTVSVPMYIGKRGQAGLAEGLSQALAGTPVRSIAIHPPYLDDISPGTAAWDAVPAREKGERATNRDIAEAVVYALTQPRHITLTITVDADQGGLHPAARRD